MHFNRYLKLPVKKDLSGRMVFIGGPRQVGKTTLTKSYLANSSECLIWDDLQDRIIIKNHRINTDIKMLALNEIHKYYRWRTFLRGLYDKHHEHLKILITGSARLDYFRKGVDSLLSKTSLAEDLEKSLSSNILYFKTRTKIPKFYQVHLGEKDYGHVATGRVLPFWKFCTEEHLI